MVSLGGFFGGFFLFCARTYVCFFFHRSRRADCHVVSPLALNAPKPAAKGKEDAQIDGAIQIVFGVKTEVGFSAWHTNVSYYYHPAVLILKRRHRCSSKLICLTTTVSAVAIFSSRGRTTSGKRYNVRFDASSS